jgi:tetratricopeptide (TPR) repeat protein
MLRFSWLLPLLFASTVARAQPGGRTEALQLFEESDRAYKAGNFEAAADLLRKAYAAYPEPILLYNLGRALEGLGHTKEAIDAYERYLHVATHVDDRGAIERRIETLKAQLAPPPVVITPPPPPVIVPPPPPPAEELDVGATAGWVVIGTGGALLATGAVFGWRASSNHDAAVNEPVQATAADLQDTAEQDATLANVMLAVGGAIVIGGGIYELLHQRAQHDGPRVAVTPRGISLGWAW